MYTHLILQYSGELKKDLCIWGCSEKWFDVDQPEIIVDSWGFGTGATFSVLFWYTLQN